MIDNDGARTPLGLGAFARIVDNERIEIWNRAQGRFGEAGGRQRHGLARQPFEVAMLAVVDDGMSSEDLTQPNIKGEIAVRRHKSWIMVGTLGVDVVATSGLNGDHGISVNPDRKAKVAIRE